MGDFILSEKWLFLVDQKNEVDTYGSEKCGRFKLKKKMWEISVDPKHVGDFSRFQKCGGYRNICKIW